MKQKTLKGSFSLFGKGLHTGLNLTVTFNPAPENTGYKIQRIDLEGEPVIDAIAENVVDTQRGTVLGKGEARVSTVEHGLSALYALGIEKPDHMIANVPAELFGESREKTVEPNPMSPALRGFRKLLYVFVRMVNLLVSLFDK